MCIGRATRCTMEVAIIPRQCPLLRTQGDLKTGHMRCRPAASTGPPTIPRPNSQMPRSKQPKAPFGLTRPGSIPPNTSIVSDYARTGRDHASIPPDYVPIGPARAWLAPAAPTSTPPAPRANPTTPPSTLTTPVVLPTRSTSIATMPASPDLTAPCALTLSIYGLTLTTSRLHPPRCVAFRSSSGRHASRSDRSTRRFPPTTPASDPTTSRVPLHPWQSRRRRLHRRHPGLDRTRLRRHQG
jgi:hypothetical protein